MATPRSRPPLHLSIPPATRTSPAQRLRTLYDHLLLAYGPRAWWPPSTSEPVTPFEVIVGAYLVQNTSWRGVVRSIANLHAHRVLHPQGMLAIPVDDLRTLIRPSGYMVRKAAALKAFAAFLDHEHHGSLPALAALPTAAVRLRLLALPGVGPETADAILLYALGHPVIVVDEYLRRIAARHGLAPAQAGYAQLQQLALSAFSHDRKPTLLQHFNEFHALIVEAGKNHCGPAPRCAGCPLAPLLP